MNKGFSNINEFPVDFRQTEMKRIFSCIERSQSLQIVAPTGAGKSMVLKAITQSSKIKEKYLGANFESFKFVLIDLKLLLEKNTSSILEFMAQKLAAIIGKSSLELDVAVSDLVQKGNHVVLIFDSFNEVQNPASLFTILKAVYDQNRGKLSYLFAVNHEVLIKDSDFEKLKHLSPILTENILFLPPLTKKDFSWFTEEQENYQNLNLTSDEKDRLFVLSGGYMATSKRIMETLKDKVKLTQIETNPEKIERISYHFQALLKDLDKEANTLKRLMMKNASLDDIANINYLQRSFIINKDNDLTIPLLKTYLLNTTEVKETKEIISDLITLNSQLTAQEYKIVKYLTNKLNQYCSREEIIEGVWGVKSQKGISNHALDQIIYRLRKKLEKNDPQLKIETIWGRGHKAILIS